MKIDGIGAGAFGNHSAGMELADLGRRLTTDPGAFNEVKVAGDPRQQAEAVAKQLESVFFQMMMSEMRKTVQAGDLMGGKSPAVRQFQSMLDEQIANSGGFGVDPVFHASLVAQIAGDESIRDAALGRAGSGSVLGKVNTDNTDSTIKF